MTTTHLVRGKQAEWTALKFLKQKGLRFVAKNYRCYHGEIDLILLDKSTLVFVEVRLRNNLNFGSPPTSITPAKIDRLCKTAQHFLQKNKKFKHSIQRFDVIGMRGDNQIEWIKNAITVQYGF